MSFKLDDLVYIMEKLNENGIDAVIIGGTVVELEARSKTFTGDIDLFPLKPSPTMEEGYYYEVAEKLNWDYGQTGLGTPKFVAKTGSGPVEVEFYDNILDFYVPEEILKEAKTINVKGVPIKRISVEDYLVLKSRSELPTTVDVLRGVYELWKSGKISINVRRIKERLNLFPPEEVPIMRGRLKEAGFEV